MFILKIVQLLLILMIVLFVFDVIDIVVLYEHRRLKKKVSLNAHAVSLSLSVSFVEGNATGESKSNLFLVNARKCGTSTLTSLKKKKTIYARG